MRPIIENCDLLRKVAIKEIFNGKVFRNSFEKKWKDELQNKIIENGNNGFALISLGNHLSDIFGLTKGEGREGANSQSSLSGGGAAWEGLVTWYLNIVLAGTRSVALKMNKRIVPSPFLEAISVSYSNHKTNTESDIIVITFPDITISPPEENEKLLHENIEAFSRENFSEFSLDIVQCKTNWNDNAQIPMLWDMLYSAETFNNKQISIGTTQFRIPALKNFSYSFVTVPTSRGPFKTNSLSVLRVNNISGGNYWGKPSEKGIANSLTEIFNRNLGHSCNDFIRNADKTLLKINDKYKYFWGIN